jgi:Flp pilus assembly pilin Flp
MSLAVETGGDEREPRLEAEASLGAREHLRMPMTHRPSPPEAPEPHRSLHADTRGLSTVEYIIILILIAVIAITAWKQFGESVEYHVRDSTTQINHLGD